MARVIGVRHLARLHGVYEGSEGFQGVPGISMGFRGAFTVLKDFRGLQTSSRDPRRARSGLKALRGVPGSFRRRLFRGISGAEASG